MIEIGRRARNQPPPPRVVFEALINPDRDPDRRWLDLLDDEARPEILESQDPSMVVWSSIWLKRPDAKIRFDLPPGGAGTELCWSLFVDKPPPDEALIGHMCKRVNQLINETCVTASGSNRYIRSCRLRLGAAVRTVAKPR